MPKNYQVINEEVFKNNISDYIFEFPLNIIEIDVKTPRSQRALFKILPPYFKISGFKNASTPQYSWWQKNIFQKNKKVINFLESHKIPPTQITEIAYLFQFVDTYTIFSLELTNFFQLDNGIQSIALSKYHDKILVDASGFYLGKLIVLFHFVNDFIQKGGQCVMLRNKHFEIIEDDFASYKSSFVPEADNNLKLWYLENSPNK